MRVAGRAHAAGACGRRVGGAAAVLVPRQLRRRARHRGRAACGPGVSICPGTPGLLRFLCRQHTGQHCALVGQAGCQSCLQTGSQAFQESQSTSDLLCTNIAEMQSCSLCSCKHRASQSVSHDTIGVRAPSCRFCCVAVLHERNHPVASDDPALLKDQTTILTDAP